MKFLASTLLAVLLLPASLAQAPGTVLDSGPDLTGADPAFVTFPDDGIDYEGCMRDLVASDLNGDGVVKSNEYLTFIQTYGKRICHVTDRLSLEQRAAFNALACRCQTREGTKEDCCLGDNAEILTAGALDSGRTKEQQFYLTAVCRVTDNTIYEPRGCPPERIDPNDPPPFSFAVPATPITPATGDSGLSPGAIAGIVIAAIAFLLLLCCCCCFVFKRRKAKEEEEEVIEKKIEEVQDLEQAPEQAPGMMEDTAMPAAVLPLAVPQPDDSEDERARGGSAPIDEYEDDEDIEKARGSAMIEDEVDEEEIRKSRGFANLPPEDDPNKRRIRGEGEIPDDEYNPERVILNPIPDKEEEEDPDWDQPGRDINFPKEKDEMSEGHVDHYEPDGGVYIPERESKEAQPWRRDWERPEVEDPDEHDNRKHRIQAGLGEGEVWDKLNEQDDDVQKTTDTGDVFDWVVQSALGALDGTDANKA